MTRPNKASREEIKRAVEELYEAVKKVVSETYLLGDAHSPQKVMEALSEAADVGARV